MQTYSFFSLASGVKKWRLGLCGLLLMALGGCDRTPPVVDELVTPRDQIELPKDSQPRSVVTYERGRFSASLSGSMGGFGAVTDEEREVQSRLLEQLQNNPKDKAVYEEVLAEARTMESELILGIAMKILESPDAEIRAQGLMLVDGVSDGAVVPLLEKGYDDVDLDVRQLAMESALAVRSPEVERLMTRGLADQDETIRQTAFQVGLNQEGELAERALVVGMSSPYEDLGLSALAMAENELSKRLLPSVFKALDHPSPEVKESAREMMYFFFHETFQSGTEAARWWGSNGRYYDDDLVYGGPTQ